jgi:hypothetical protein
LKAASLLTPLLLVLPWHPPLAADDAKDSANRKGGEIAPSAALTSANPVARVIVSP